MSRRKTDREAPIISSQSVARIVFSSSSIFGYRLEKDPINGLWLSWNTSYRCSGLVHQLDSAFYVLPSNFLRCIESSRVNHPHHSTDPPIRIGCLAHNLLQWCCERQHSTMQHDFSQNCISPTWKETWKYSIQCGTECLSFSRWSEWGYERLDDFERVGF